MSNASSAQEILKSALSNNEKWHSSLSKSDPELFPTLAKGQSPKILWFGCSDSRCPETTLLGLKPGDIFVHRNIANVLVPTDLSYLAVLEYAVSVVGVTQVIVAGHTSCGGVAATLGTNPGGVIGAWLAPLRKLRESLMGESGYDALDEKEKMKRLIVKNVNASCTTVRDSEHVIKAKKERGLCVVGIVYDVGSGKIEVVDEDKGSDQGKEAVYAVQK